MATASRRLGSPRTTVRVLDPEILGRGFASPADALAGRMVAAREAFDGGPEMANGFGEVKVTRGRFSLG
jgi:hypothetical protein